MNVLDLAAGILLISVLLTAVILMAVDVLVRQRIREFLNTIRDEGRDEV